MLMKFPHISIVLWLLLALIGCQSAPSPVPSRSEQRPATSLAKTTPSPQAIQSAPPDHVSSESRYAKKAGGRKIASVTPPPPPPTEGNAGPADEDTVLANAADHLPVGQVAIEHPAQMVVSKAGEVRVRISRDQKLDLSAGLTANGQTTEHGSIAVSASMKVQLHGEPYFNVQPLSDTEQLITNSSFTEWSFTVVPLQSGDLPLHVSITAVVRAAGIEKTKDFPVKDEMIQVRVSPMGAIESFVANNWQWLWSTILAPIALWLWKRKAGRNQPPRSGNAASPTDRSKKQATS